MAFKSTKISFSILSLIVIVIVGIGAFVLGKQSANLGTLKNQVSVQNKNANPLFTTQTATIRGKITKVDGNKLSIINSKNVQGEIEADKKVLITSLSLNPKTPSSSPSSDLKTIELNREVYISLELSGDKYERSSTAYKAVLIQYLPPLSPLPKSPATNSSVKR